MLAEVGAVIQAHLNQGQRVLVAASGGPDSSALLHLLYTLGLDLGVAHVDHGVRAESVWERERLQSWVEGLGLPFFCKKFSAEHWHHAQGGFQAAARKERYQFFQTIMEEEGYQVLALGHNENDQAETLLAHILRGAGLTGLAGMPIWSPLGAGSLIRPLLGVSRTQIEAYCRDEELPVSLDPSNESLVYQRNWIRLEVLPLLKKENPRICQSLAQTAELCRADEEYLESQTLGAYLALGHPVAGGVEVSWEFRDLPLALKRRLLRRLLKEAWGEWPQAGWVEDGLRFLDRPSPDQSEIRPGLWLMTHERGWWLGRLGQEYEVSLSLGQKVRAPEGWLDAQIVEGEAPQYGGGYRELVSLGALRPPLSLGTLRAGERFWPLGAPGMKTVSQFLLDAKIPLWERSRLPVLRDQEKVVWVVGHRIDERVRLSCDEQVWVQLVYTPDPCASQRPVI